MLNLRIGSNTKSSTILIDPSKTAKEAFDEAQIQVGGNAAIHFNGTLIPGADINKSLTALGAVDGGDAMLVAIVKADSAKY